MNSSDLQNLLELQQLFHDKYLTKQLLTEMIKLYVQVVDHFTKQNCIKFYFMGKMQMVISRPQIMQLLDQQKNKEEMSRETIKNLQLKSSNNGFKKNKSNMPQLDPQERDIKIKLQLNLMKEMDQNMHKISKDVDDVEVKEQQQVKQIYKQIQKQDNDLNMRLKRRKKKRKKSADLQDFDKEDIPLIQKQQLIEVQKDLTEAVIRFTARLTERQQLKTNVEKFKQVNNQERLGKVDQSKQIKQQDEDQDYFCSVQSVKGVKQQQSNKITELNQTQGQLEDYQKDKFTSKQTNQQQQQENRNLGSVQVRTGTRKGKHFEHDPNDVGRVTFRTNTQQQQQDDDYF